MRWGGYIRDNTFDNLTIKQFKTPLDARFKVILLLSSFLQVLFIRQTSSILFPAVYIEQITTSSQLVNFVRRTKFANCFFSSRRLC